MSIHICYMSLYSRICRTYYITSQDPTQWIFFFVSFTLPSKLSLPTSSVTLPLLSKRGLKIRIGFGGIVIINHHSPPLNSTV